MSDYFYRDDDRDYIRARPRKTETFSMSVYPPEQKMSIIQDYLANPTNASSSVQGKHTVYWMPYTTFAKLKIKQWKYNRPCDEGRVTEIREWMDQSKRVDGVIYLACVDDDLVCYESNHRRLALRGLEGLHSILVDILWDATNDDVKQEFQRLNKAVSVPEIYVAEVPAVSVRELEDVIDEFCTRYPTHRSTSFDKCNRPNFIKDKLSQVFYNLCEQRGISPRELLTRVYALNTRLATTPPAGEKRPSVSILEKCAKSGLWLFAWKQDQLIAQNLV